CAFALSFRASSSEYCARVISRALTSILSVTMSPACAVLASSTALVLSASESTVPDSSTSSRPALALTLRSAALTAGSDSSFVLTIRCRSESLIAELLVELVDELLVIRSQAANENAVMSTINVVKIPFRILASFAGTLCSGQCGGVPVTHTHSYTAHILNIGPCSRRVCLHSCRTSSRPVATSCLAVSGSGRFRKQFLRLRLTCYLFFLEARPICFCLGRDLHRSTLLPPPPHHSHVWEPLLHICDETVWSASDREPNEVGRNQPKTPSGNNGAATSISRNTGAVGPVKPN